MKRIYIAGPYSAPDIISGLNNIREGQRTAVQVLLAGFAPFCPWLDFHFQLMLRPGESLNVHHYYEYSMAWLRAADGVLAIKGWKNSRGACAEIEEAERLSIPVFFSLEEIKDHFDGR